MPTVYEKFVASASQSSPNKRTNQRTHLESQQIRHQRQSIVTSEHNANGSPTNKPKQQAMINIKKYQSSVQINYSNNEQQKSNKLLHSFFKTEDPVLIKWLQAMRFETELECLTSLQARTLAIDQHSAGALNVRNSQVSIQQLRLESNFLLDFIDHLIECLPLNQVSLQKFSFEFTELWTKVSSQTAAKNTNNQTVLAPSNNNNCNYFNNNINNLTIINCTPKKNQQIQSKTLKPLDKLAVQVRNICIEFANTLYEYQEFNAECHSITIDNDYLESTLRKLKELYGKFIEFSIKIECTNIIRALQFDFSRTTLNRLSSSTSSLRPTRPFESSSSQLPLKWALIALWQLTNEDSYICRILTEKWQTTIENSTKTCAKRLDYSTKYDTNVNNDDDLSKKANDAHSLRADYEKMYQICCQNHGFNEANNNSPSNNKTFGALSSALKSKQSPVIKQVSTIELLIDIIISQPNKHERLDMMNFIHLQAQNNKLIDLDEWDQNVTAAIYTSNQYKVAALRILNHLCINEQAIKTILKCLSTPPPTSGQPVPENKIIRSIFECYQTSQEHIYQNETVLREPRGRKRLRHQSNILDNEFNCADDYSDYGSRQTNSLKDNYCDNLTNSNDGDDDTTNEGDDLVVKEAIRLIIQLTNPFHKSNQGHDYYTLIGRFSIESLVKYLTNIIKSTNNKDLLYLTLTALSNISFITTEPMIQYNTNRIILEMFTSSLIRSKDIQLRDQAVTILANTASTNLFDIINNGGLTFLLSCLESCPTLMAKYKQSKRYQYSSHNNRDYQSLAELENHKPRDRRPIDLSNDYPDFLDCACENQQQQQDPNNLCINRLSVEDLATMERIHQKAAVAFARMSIDPATIKIVERYGGVKMLIDLCKFRHKRNHSDTVLIACIAALKKMAKVIDYETFRHYNALDLIELEFNQALQIYGNYVQRHDNLYASDV